MTDFARLKSKHVDLVPTQKTFECDAGLEQVADDVRLALAGLRYSQSRVLIEFPRRAAT